jgi:hypothetical protein
LAAVGVNFARAPPSAQEVKPIVRTVARRQMKTRRRVSKKKKVGRGVCDRALDAGRRQVEREQGDAAS